MVRPAILWKTAEHPRDAVKCIACSHYCVVPPGRRGVCGVRENRDGKLVTLVFDRVLGMHADPIEKKPLYHFLPGSTAYSFGTVGCNFKCDFCQNADMSQEPKPLQGGSGDIIGTPVTPKALVEEAQHQGCASIAYTYNEPIIFVELALETMKLARKAGLKNIFVSNGYESEEAFDVLAPYLDAMNIDVKAFTDAFYNKTCGGRLQPVLDTIKRARSADIWIEVTTLIIPGKNDSNEELRKIAAFIASVDTSIPWHLSRFYPMHHMLDVKPTPLATLERAYEIGKKAGLEQVYVGNVQEEAHHDTICPSCSEKVIKRGSYYRGIRNELREGACPKCGATIAGVWG